MLKTVASLKTKFNVGNGNESDLHHILQGGNSKPVCKTHSLEESNTRCPSQKGPQVQLDILTTKILRQLHSWSHHECLLWQQALVPSVTPACILQQFQGLGGFPQRFQRKFWATRQSARTSDSLQEAPERGISEVQ